MTVDVDFKNDEGHKKFDELENNISQTGNTASDSMDNMDHSDLKAPLKTPAVDASDTQVKFLINDSLNNKGKCMAEKAIPSFSGLSKEELLKYAKDPFWIRIRMLLFSLFWMSWLAMFVAAITIIVMAPKCEGPKKPKWYQQGPLYELDVSQFSDAQGSESILQAIEKKLEYFSSLKIKGLILSPIFKADEGNEESVLDFELIDEKYGSIEDFKNLINNANDKGINIILSFVPNHSSNRHEWFNKSVARISPYDNYYVWGSALNISSNDPKLPPNNWLSVTGGSAWSWNEERQEFYLHQFSVDLPDLNYRNNHVLEEIKNVFLYWLQIGVKGFNLDKIQFLLEDSEQKSEIPNGKPGAVHTDYEFYSHGKTHNLPEVANILLSWRNEIKKATNDEGILIVTGDVPMPSDFNSTTILVDISRNEKLLKDLPQNFTARDIYPQLNEIINSKIKWPSVQLGHRHAKRICDTFGEENIDNLNMLTMLLPATPVIYFGEELGLCAKYQFTDVEIHNQENKNESHYKVFKAIVSARETQTALFGEAFLNVVNNSVLVLTRIYLGNPGYLLAYNPSSHDLNVDLSVVSYVPEDLMLYVKKTGSHLNTFPSQGKLKSKNVFLESKSAAVFTFAPKVDD